MENSKKKIIVFDLDGTLATVGEKIPDSVVKSLKMLERKGLKIAVCSGKPTYYLSGLFRQVGIKDVILVGENGATISVGTSLPPKARFSVELTAQQKTALKEIKNQIRSKLPNVWFQPNEVGLTAFFETEDEKSVISQIIADNRLIGEHFTVFTHCDSFDFSPKGVDKKTALETICNELGFCKCQFVAVGDGENDYPMFDFAPISLGVEVKDESRVTNNFVTIYDCLDYILENFGE